MANFKLVPLHYQLLVVNLFTILGARQQLWCWSLQAGVASWALPAAHQAQLLPPPCPFTRFVPPLPPHCSPPSADSCFMSWSRANDGWFPRLFPVLAAKLGMDNPPSSGSAAAAAAGGKPAAGAAAVQRRVAASSAKTSA